MDPNLARALSSIAALIIKRSPGTAAEILSYLNGRGTLSAATLMLIRPQLLAQGINPASLPATPGSSPDQTGLPVPTGSTPPVGVGGGATGGGHDMQVPISQVSGEPAQFLGAQGGGRDDRTTIDQVSGTQGATPTPPTATPPPPLIPLGNGSQGGLRDEKTTVDQISGAPAATPGTKPTGSGSGWATTTGIGLAGDDNGAVRFALQEAGLDPDRLGHFGNIIARALAPMILARRNTVGLTGSGNTGTIPQELADFTKMFTTKGVDAFGEAAKYGQSILNSPGLAGYLKNITNGEDQGQFYQGLLPLLYGGANPLIQQAAADASQRYLNQYRDAELRGGGVQPGGGVFSTWLDAQPNVDPFVRRIFGR